jgi:hypothetical protein
VLLLLFKLFGKQRQMTVQQAEQGTGKATW